MGDAMKLDYESAKTAAEVGITRSATHANAVHEGWVDDAVESLRMAIALFPRGSDFTIEQVRQKITNLPKPPDLRAWGSVTRRAVKLNYVIKSGNFRTAVSSNNSPKPLYVHGDAS
jgi:hypothetical protein